MTLIAVLPDQQIPHHDPKVHELVLYWLSQNSPDTIVISGDAIDLPMLSRHGWNPKMVKDPVSATQFGLDSTRKVLSEYGEASGADDLYFIPGNHEERLQRYIIQQAPMLFGLRKADAEEQADSVLSLPYLLGLSNLGYQWITGQTGEWPQAELKLSKYLAVRHGWLARKQSGASAHATLDHLGYSVIVGHTHRQGQVYRTRHCLDGSLTINTAVEAGTLALTKGGLGYAVAPDWQPGFAVVRLHANGQFNITLAHAVGGALLWENQRFYRSRGGIHLDE